ncbi:MAG TPA: isocitrate/isopropylmalate family dehydrogenase, partial [Candidatus Eisenbacteria bacterium]|nr:isocitrate/isopropylmalate family dehydrogenase [Candidatus Eisenbacteria bacterium]
MIRVTLIPGDGIGPSVTESAKQIIEASGADIEWTIAMAGESALSAHGSPLPDATLASVRETRIALKGPCTTPVGLGFRSVNVALRQELDLYANVRPAVAFPGVPCLYPGLDLVVIRENTEGLYSNMEHWIGNHDAAIGIGVNTRASMERVSRFALEYARRHSRKKVTAVHKANILKKLSGLFLEVARETSTRYPDIVFEDRIIDATAMHLVRNPFQFDVIVTTNLFGDILSDLTAGLVGGLGLAPGANIGEDAAIFEAVHGSAPDIAGKDVANPGAVILAGVMMLRHLELSAHAERIETALRKVLKEGVSVTRDLNPERGVGTRAMTQAILA